jgi:general secretion pathway protein B
MSYILDALRKADAQRMRDPAQGIHAQAPVAPALAARPARPLQAWPGGAVVALLAIVILATAGWFWLVAQAPVAQSEAHAVPPIVLPPPVQQAAPAAAVLPAAPAIPARVPVPVALPHSPIVTAPTAPVAARSAVPAAPASAPMAERIYSFAELPADVRQALPKFSVSGGVYSDNVAQRMLIVNGQVFNEGSEIAPAVVLEQIRPRVAQLKFRGLRIAQPY